MRHLLLAVLALSAAPALAEEPGPVCGSPLVLQLVAETLHRAGQPAVIEPGTAGQIPAAADTVRCAVRVHRRVFDTNRAGYMPLDRVSVFEYTLEQRRNGIFLRPAP